MGVLLNDIESCAVSCRCAKCAAVVKLVQFLTGLSYLAPPTGDLLPGSRGAPIGGSSPRE